eukprot:2258544-Pyramimonas_sp.AAC.1
MRVYQEHLAPSSCRRSVCARIMHYCPGCSEVVVDRQIIRMEFVGRQIIRMEFVGRDLPPLILTSALETISNCWNTTLRYRSGSPNCLFGCAAMGGGNLQRHLRCPAFQPEVMAFPFHLPLTGPVV